MIVRDRLRLGVDQKFIGIAAARFAIQRRSPLAENAFEFFLRHSCNLLDRFDAKSTQRSLREFTDAGNFSYRQRRETTLLAAGRNTDEAKRLGLVGGDFRNEPRCHAAPGAS